MNRGPSPAALKRRCEAFNLLFPVGTRVVVRKDDGTGTETTTRSPAEVLSDHTAVIWLDGITGCYALDRITPITG